MPWRKRFDKNRTKEERGQRGYEVSRLGVWSSWDIGCEVRVVGVGRTGREGERAEGRKGGRGC